MNLNAYSFRDIQNCRALLTDMQRRGAESITEALKILMDYHPPRENASNGRLCPSCGKPTWRKRKMADGIERLWCKSCTYSEVI